MNHFLQLSFVEHTEALLLISQLHGERVLVDANPADALAVARHHCDALVFFGNVFARIEDRFPNVSSRPAHPDARKIRTEDAAFVANTMAGTAAVALVDLPA